MPKPFMLIVEDDPTTRFMMGEYCDKLGYAHESAASGAQCLTMMRTNPRRADIVLMDINMPGLSGLETCAMIREVARNSAKPLIVLALTADEFWHDPAHVAAAGFDGVLPKPVSIDRLRDVLQDLQSANSDSTAPSRG